MIQQARDHSRKMKTYPGERLGDLPQIQGLDPEIRREIEVVANVLPFKLNDYVVENLIDWRNIPDDPIYRLTFPHRDMLAGDDFDAIAALIDRGAPRAEIRDAANTIRRRMNPHPGGQLEKNVPRLDGEVVEGLQHKYRETVLYFPAQGQTCHAYCGYCFRWAQFVGIQDLKQMNRDAEQLANYLRQHPYVSDVLVTGGDPMVMKTATLARYLEPLLADDLSHVQTIRIGTKALAYWPQRFTTDADADELLRLLERFAEAGRHVALMAHFTHPAELGTPEVRDAIRRIRDTGTVIRAQSPIVRHVNDDADAWATMWREEVRLGIVPYYMFVERDTGARRYYEIPLHHAWNVYHDAIQRVSGLARTVRGPSMSATPGKVTVDGVTEIHGERVFVLRFLQGRNPAWSNRPFFARFDPTATWLDGLRPAFGEAEFFFERDETQDWRELEPSTTEVEEIVGAGRN